MQDVKVYKSVSSADNMYILYDINSCYYDAFFIQNFKTVKNFNNIESAGYINSISEISDIGDLFYEYPANVKFNSLFSNNTSVCRKMIDAFALGGNTILEYINNTFYALINEHHINYNYQVLSFVSIWSGSDYGYWTVYSAWDNIRALIWIGPAMYVSEYAVSTSTVTYVKQVNITQL